MALPIGYHWRNLFVRKTSTLLTVLVVAAVVGALTWILGFATALSDSMAMASDPLKVLVIRQGSESETNSAIQTEEFNRLTQIRGAAVGADGRALVSPEVMVQISVPRKTGKGRANVAVRGVTDLAFEVHRNIKPLGQRFSTTEPEVIVGKRAAEQYVGLEIGAKVRLGTSNNREYRVVGFFSADGGPLESEIWGYLPSIQNAYGREGFYSSAAIRVADAASVRPLVEQIGAPPIQLLAESEAAYWKRQSKFFDAYKATASALVGVISIAAVFAIANTLYSMVAGRAREIAMLRTIGFGGRAILTGFVLESIMLSLIGGVLGCLGCSAWLALAGNTKDMFGASTFTALAFEIRLTPWIIAVAMSLVVGIGIIGALFPAVRASRLEVLAALREA
ncbi:MAG: ABC transporter permease [Phycisphaerales bacterium]|nr:ABC transporter permease [Phycisphaerales bacterium]